MNFFFQSMLSLNCILSILKISLLNLRGLYLMFIIKINILRFYEILRYQISIIDILFNVLNFNLIISAEGLL